MMVPSLLVVRVDVLPASSSMPSSVSSGADGSGMEVHSVSDSHMISCIHIDWNGVTMVVGMRACRAVEQMRLTMGRVL